MRLGRVLVMAALADARATGSPGAAMRELEVELPDVRHVVFHIVTGPQQVAAEEMPHLDAVAGSGTPLWFARLFDLTLEMQLFPIVVAGREVGQVAMLSNPLDEIGEIWKELARLAAILPVASATVVALILWTVRSALKPVRELHHGFDRLERGDYAARLRPLALEALGLAEVLRDLVASWQERCPEIAICVRAEAPFAGDEAAELALYRVAQECQMNAIRHAGAEHVDVCLEHADGANCLIVRDDGRGLPAGLHLGFGLMGMTERVRALRGSVAIGGAVCGGTEITATIPLAVALPA
ncbi:MAG: sensor histidine kinase [Acetobacteraceae bacterium]